MQQNFKFSELPLESSKAKIIQSIGEPLGESSREDIVVSRYSSNSQQTAHFMYFKQDTLLQKSISVVNDQLVLADFIKEYGQPETAVYIFQSENHFDLTTLSLWPQRGIAVLSASHTGEAKVERVQFFVPMSLEEYGHLTAVDLSQKKTAELIVVHPSSTPTSIAIETQPVTERVFVAQPQYLIIAIIIGILLVVATILLNKKSS